MHLEMEPVLSGVPRALRCAERDAASLSDVQRFRGGLVFKAHRLLYHSTLGVRVIQKRRRRPGDGAGAERSAACLELRREGRRGLTCLLLGQ